MRGGNGERDERRRGLRPPRWLRRAAGVVAGGVFLWAVAGFYGVPAVLRHLLERNLSAALHRKAAIHAVRFDPFAFRLELDGFSLTEPDGLTPFASFDSLVLNVEAASLARRAPVLSEVALRNPRLSLVRLGPARTNVSDLLHQDLLPARFSVANIQVSGGSVDVDDRVTRTTHRVTELRLGLPFLSSLPAHVAVFVRPSFEAVVDGTRVSLSGRSRPFAGSRETLLEIAGQGLDLASFLPYLPSPVPARLAKGTLDAKLTVSFSRTPRGTPAIALSGTVGASNVAVVDGEGRPLLSAPRITATLESLEPLRASARVERVLLSAPRLTVVRDRAGRLNLEDLLPAPQTDPAPHLQLGELRVAGGSVAFTDEEAGFDAALAAVELAVKGAGSDPARPVDVQLSFETPAGEKVSHASRLVRSPYSLSGTVAVSGVALPAYRAYTEPHVPFRVEAGSLDGRARFEAKDSGLAVRDLELTFSGLRLRQPGARAPFLDAWRLGVAGGEVDPVRRSVSARSATAAGVTLRAVRDAAGRLDLASVVPEALAAAARVWTARLERLTLSRGTLRFTDLSTPTPAEVSLHRVSADALGLSTRPGEEARLSARARVNGTARVSLGGAVGLAPLSARLETGLSGLDLVPFQAWLAPAARLRVTSGRAGLAGTLVLAGPGPGPLSGSFTGDATVDGLTVADPGTRAEVVSCGSLRLHGVEAGTTPPRLVIAEADLAAPVVRLVGGAARPSAAEAAGPGTPLEVALVTLAGGRLELGPEVVTGLGGRVTGLSTTPGTAAALALRGSLGQAPVEVDGTLGPGGTGLAGDLSVAVTGADLGPSGPWAGTLDGARVEGGTLDLSSRVRIRDRSVEMTSRLVVDRLALGAPPTPPAGRREARLRLAAALLSDAQGRIVLDLPGTASLDDPGLGVGTALRGGLEALLERAAACPFALLGPPCGTDEELSRVAFAPGSARLDESGQRKAGSLGRALAGRPALRVEAAGRVDPERDSEALAALSVERKLKAVKRARMLERGEAAPELDEVEVRPQERDALLAAAYRREPFPKPRNLLGLPRKLPPAEMEAALRAHAAVTDEDLHRLALGRARAVKERLVAAGPLDPDRVTLADAGPADGTAGAGAARVDLTLAPR